MEYSGVRWGECVRRWLQPMIVLITGSRAFEAEVLREVRKDVYRELDALHKTAPTMTLLSGGARGVDRLGERWARARGVDLVVRPPARKKATVEAMVEACDGVVAFWDGASEGTRRILEHARNKLLVCSEYGRA